MGFGLSFEALFSILSLYRAVYNDKSLFYGSF